MEQLRDDKPDSDDITGEDCEIDGEERREDEAEQEEELKEEEEEVEDPSTSFAVTYAPLQTRPAPEPDLPTLPAVPVSFFPERIKWKKIVEDMKRKEKEMQEEEEGQDNR